MAGLAQQFLDHATTTSSKNITCSFSHHLRKYNMATGTRSVKIPTTSVQFGAALLPPYTLHNNNNERKRGSETVATIPSYGMVQFTC